MKLVVPNGFASLPERAASWSDFACGHPMKGLRRLVQSDGRPIVVNQCTTCGANCGAVRKGGIAVHELKEFDEVLRKGWSEKQNRQFEEKRSREQEEWNRWYATYLASPKWHRLRGKVLARDRYQCQGCHDTGATQVHHLTYERVGNELMFDLIAVCDACHRVAHPDKA